MERRGEKIGWIAGWLGGFCWVLLLGGVLVFLGKPVSGAIGILLFFTAVVFILYLTPWRFPDTKYWKLLLPLYVLLFGCVVFFVVSWDKPEEVRLPWYGFFWLLPLLSPFFTIGRKTWNHLSPGSDVSPPAENSE